MWTRPGLNKVSEVFFSGTVYLRLCSTRVEDKVVCDFSKHFSFFVTVRRVTEQNTIFYVKSIYIKQFTIT